MRKFINYSKKLLNLDLPARKLAIKFTVPSTLSDIKKPDLISLLVGSRTDDQKDLISYLKLMQKQARQLTQCVLATAARVSYTHKCFASFTRSR